MTMEYAHVKDSGYIIEGSTGSNSEGFLLVSGYVSYNVKKLLSAVLEWKNFQLAVRKFKHEDIPVVVLNALANNLNYP